MKKYKIRQVILVLAIGFIATVLSAKLFVTYENRFVGGVTEPEYDYLPQGGFPFAYLQDSPGMTGQGRLSLIEDDFSVQLFLADMAIFSVVAFGVIAFVSAGKARGLSR